MLTTLREILAHARENRYAVPGFDCVEDVMVRAILETAESLHAPVILMALPSDLAGNGMTYVPRLVRAVADHHPIPVALHLDHATDLDLVKKAIDCGFTSVMVDGSSLPFDDNVRLTQAAVELAHPHGISVEAELGHVGGMDLEETACAESVLTDPVEVTKFVEQTAVDALAVSIGTAHGVYRSTPNLAIDRLREINAVSQVPLVLHGGSGTPDDQIQAAVRNGICKLNIYADCRIAMARGLKQAAATITREDPLPAELFRTIKQGVSSVVAEKIRLLMAENRAWTPGGAA
ncbi:MAG: class II fructose-bisphosphate aldolase [Rhodopirellula sp.]|nr:class II fructose-bisphosphate aldolase [Rhodopirellula sp.]